MKNFKENTARAENKDSKTFLKMNLQKWLKLPLQYYGGTETGD